MGERRLSSTTGAPMSRQYAVTFLVVLVAFFGLYYWRAQDTDRLDASDHQEICEKLTAWWR